MGAVTRVVIIMPLTKECPQCCSVVNVRKSKFPCGHLFVTKRSKPVLTIKSRKHRMISLHSLHRTCHTTGSHNLHTFILFEHPIKIIFNVTYTAPCQAFGTTVLFIHFGKLKIR